MFTQQDKREENLRTFNFHMENAYALRIMGSEKYMNFDYVGD